MAHGYAWTRETAAPAWCWVLTEYLSTFVSFIPSYAAGGGPTREADEADRVKPLTGRAMNPVEP